MCHGASAPAEYYLILIPTLPPGVFSSGARFINRCQNVALCLGLAVRRVLFVRITYEICVYVCV